MRNRLSLAFFGVICLTLGLVYLFVENSSTSVLKNSLTTAFQKEIRPLVPQLTAYYVNHNQSWEGVDRLLITADKTAPQLVVIDQYQSDDLILIDATGKVAGPWQSPFYGRELDAHVLESTLPIVLEGKTVGYLGSALLIGDLLPIVEIEFNKLLSRSILIALLASGIIAMFYALLATNTVVQPIMDMTETVEEMARGNLNLRVDPEKYGYQNLVTLAESINFLTDSVDKVGNQRKQMVSDIAHELRTPLAVQKSYLEAMEDEIIPFSKDSLKTIQEQNLLLTRLVNDLRVLAAAEAGELHLVLRQTDLTMALQNVLEQFSVKLVQAGLKVNLMTPDPHPIILGDPSRIEQIINNLLQNETRYAPTGSSIDISCYIRDHKAVLSVRDYGIGVPEDEREAIFKRLYRTDRSIRSVSGGSGLGLPIARKLAEAHGGTLIATAPRGKGVEFTLTLPLSFEPIKLPKAKGRPKNF